jgi:hypothetical protein
MKSYLSLAACLPVIVIACGGSADLGGSYDGGASCAEVCCVPSPIGVGTPSFQCVGAGVTCSLPNAACEPADAGASDASCAAVCCAPPPDGRGNPSFQCVGPGPVVCVLPNSDCLPTDAGPSGADGGVPCTKTADCFGLTSGGMDPYVCGYPLAAGCAAQGTCLPAGPLCDMPTPIACACDGTSVGYGECSGYPTGYAGAPTVHTGSCAQDGGTLACQTAADCSGVNQVCVQDYDPQVGSNPVSSKCIDNPCGTAPLACTCAVTPACSGFSVNCAIGTGGVVECLGNG